MKAKFPYAKRNKRVGRGLGSGHGKTSCRGQKGAGSRSGWKKHPGFEGGQNPIYRRIPKRGFNNEDFRKRYALINLDRIAALDLNEITPETLQAKGVVKDLALGLKVLGRGEIKKAVTVKAHRFSGSAKAKIEKAGGQAVILEKAKKHV